MRIADNDTRRKIIDSGELVSYCERYGMEVQDEIKVNQQNPNANFSSSSGYVKDNSNVEMTILNNEISINANGEKNGIYCGLTRKAGNVYLLSIEAKVDESERGSYSIMANNGLEFVQVANDSTEWKRQSLIINQVSDVTSRTQTRILVNIFNNQYFTKYGKNFVQVNLTALGLADKSLEWLQTNRPDLFQNLDYIPETKTIKSVIRRIK